MFSHTNDDCYSQEAMAKAMGLTVTLFKRRAKVYSVNWRGAYREKQKKKRKMTTSHNNGLAMWVGLSSTGTSQYSQKPKAQRATIESSIRSGGWETMTFPSTPEASLILSLHKGLKEQLE